MGGPLLSQVSFSVPFESEPDRPNGFVSKNAQEAIEEASKIATDNDRFYLQADYNGNATSGRLLEIFTGLDTEEAPFYFAKETRVIDIVCRTTSTNSNATINFYNIDADPGLLTPLYTLDMNGQKRKIDLGTPDIPLFTMPSDSSLTIRVASSSINKPHMQLGLNSAVV